MDFYKKFGKRIFDLILSLILGVLILPPVYIVFGLLIVLESKGPAIFKQVRIGKDNIRFTIYKFRSMYLNEVIVPCKKADQRVTRIGKFIRKYKIDELPQLINVIKGDMSLVGPRPLAECFYDGFGSHDPDQKRLRVKPGLTGVSQIMRDLTGDLDKDVPRGAALDFAYVDEYSFMKDISIILQTIGYLFYKTRTDFSR